MGLCVCFGKRSKYVIFNQTGQTQLSNKSASERRSETHEDTSNRICEGDTSLVSYVTASTHSRNTECNKFWLFPLWIP